MQTGRGNIGGKGGIVRMGEIVEEISQGNVGKKFQIRVQDHNFHVQRLQYVPPWLNTDIHTQTQTAHRDKIKMTIII